MKTMKELLFLILSMGLMGSWVYHFYDKTRYTQHLAEVNTTDTLDIVESIQDSLNRKFSFTINKLDARLDSTIIMADSLHEELNNKIAEIEKLKTELETNNKLQPISKKESLLPVKPVKKEIIKPLITENKKPSVPANQVANFSISGIKLLPLVAKNEPEKLVISFDVQNTRMNNTDAELYVIVSQPDGKVMKTDIWDSYSMETQHEGRKSYTRKIRFNYEKGETKQLSFSLNPEDLIPGNYHVQIYQNGNKIGQISKMLK
jgi:hypothetical protein